MLEILRLEPTNRNITKFIKLQMDIYAGDPYYVPPLLFDLRSSLKGKNNRLFDLGPHAFFMAYRDGKPVARALAGCDEELNERKKCRQGYVSLLDFYEDYQAFEAIVDAVCAYMREINVDTLIGPNSYTFNDFGMGCLLEDYDSAPMLYGVYNKPYYPSFYERYGFIKHMDHFSFRFTPKEFEPKYERYNAISQKSMERYGFHLEPVNLKNDFHIKSVHRVFVEALPAVNDFDIPAPSLEDIYNEMREAKPFYNPDYTFLAFVGDRPIGFMFGLPDYNQVIARMKGKLLPTGVFQFLRWRRRINAVRVIICYVAEEYKNKAVPGAMFCQLYKNAVKNGVQVVEGSTIAEGNNPSLNGAIRSGGRQYRTTRQYKLDIR